MRGNVATIVPSTSANRCSSDSGRSALSRSCTTPTSRIKLSVATSALVLMPVGMLREILEVERGEERGFGRDGEKVARVSGKHFIKHLCSEVFTNHQYICCRTGELRR